MGEPVEIAVSMSDAGPGQLGINLSAPAGSGSDCNVKEVCEMHLLRSEYTGKSKNFKTGL